MSLKQNSGMERYTETNHETDYFIIMMTDLPFFGLRLGRSCYCLKSRPGPGRPISLTDSLLPPSRLTTLVMIKSKTKTF